MTNHINQRSTKREFVPLSVQEFKTGMLNELSQILKQRNKFYPFQIDDKNRELLNQFYYYLTGSEQFKQDINKGILLSGNIGVGKTIILTAFTQLIEKHTNRKITKLSSAEMDDKILKKGIDYYIKRPLYIEDLGRESKEINEFGNKFHPIKKLFSLRYEYGSWTFACANYSLKDFADPDQFYGKAVQDRMKEMFNHFELIGQSRRK